MSMKKLFLCVIPVLLGLAAVPSRAEDLMTVYRQAFANDPTFKTAHARWLAEKELVPIAKAALFPTLNVSGATARNYHTPSENNSSKYYNNTSYSLTLSQPLFNWEQWKLLSRADAAVKAATANYIAAAQDLIYRTASAYFNVLKAYEQLRYTLANKKAIHRELVTTEQQYKVGLTAITGYYDTLASYDTAIADEISARNNLNDQLENLKAITGHYYTHIQGLKTQVPLVTPKPKNINAWVNDALQQNYTLKAYQNLAVAAKEDISARKASGYPTVNFDTSYQKNHYNDYSAGTLSQASLGLSLNYPLYTGGLISAETRQARYTYAAALGQVQYQHNEVTSQTRQAYLAIISGISRIKADAQAVKSSNKQVEATQASYKVGTRNMVELLESFSQLYQSKQQYSNDQYDYLVNTILLKQYAGRLSDIDLAQINGWLRYTIKFDAKVIKNMAFKHGRPHQYFTRQNSMPPPAAPAQGTGHQHRLSKHQHRYGIQVAASQSKQKAQKIIDAYPSLQLIISKQHIQGKTWYKVIQTGFDSKKKAQAGISKLPRNLKRKQPWVIALSTAL
jgi:outer membrane protein